MSTTDVNSGNGSRGADYDLVLPRHVLFGWGRSVELGREVARLGRRALVVTGSRTLRQLGLVDALLDNLREAGLAAVEVAAAEREPTLTDIENARRDARTLDPGGADVVVAVGGGSALDLGKALAGLLPQPADIPVRDYVEGVGRGLTFSAEPLAFVAVPTTAGTGSEATKNAVITCDDPPAKKSLRHASLVARLVVIDPELTVSNAPNLTAWSGLDAVTQLIESAVSRHAKPVPLALALEGLSAAASALETAYADGGNRRAREAMAHAAFLSGVALANSGLGIAHGVAAALGALLGVPHGLACAVMLPASIQWNLEAARDRYARLATALTATPHASADEAARAVVDFVDRLLDRLHIPRRLAPLGVTREMIGPLAIASNGNSRNGNPRAFTDDELAEYLEAML